MKTLGGREGGVFGAIASSDAVVAALDARSLELVPHELGRLGALLYLDLAQRVSSLAWNGDTLSSGGRAAPRRWVVRGVDGRTGRSARRGEEGAAEGVGVDRAAGWGAEGRGLLEGQSKLGRAL